MLPGNEFLISSHLGDSEHDTTDVQNFEVSHPETGKGLEIYLKQHAFQDERLNLMRTYLVRWRKTGECAGYFSLKAGLISINERQKTSEGAFDTLPGVELANFAVNRHFSQKYGFSGLGAMLFRQLIAPFVQEHAKTLGIFMIYLFALPMPKLIKTYINYGFQRLSGQDEMLLHRRIKPVYDKSCIFMYQTLEQLSH